MVNSLTTKAIRLASAAFLSASVFSTPAKAIDSPAEAAPFQDNIDEQTMSDNMLRGDVRTEIESLAFAVRNSSPPYADPTKKEAIKNMISDAQEKLEQYRQRFVPQFFPAPLTIDGKLGPKTAEVLIKAAEQMNIKDVFIASPIFIKPSEKDISMQFLRNELEKLAPHYYIDGVRKIAQDEIQSRYLKQFNDCLEKTVALSFKKEDVAKEREKLNNDLNYVSRVIPGVCRDDFFKLNTGNRFRVQNQYFDTLDKNALKDKDPCDLKQVQPFDPPSFKGACILLKI